MSGLGTWQRSLLLLVGASVVAPVLWARIEALLPFGLALLALVIGARVVLGWYTKP